jgi:hypothetical protein
LTIKNATLNGKVEFVRLMKEFKDKSSMEAYEVREELLKDDKKVLYS